MNILISSLRTHHTLANFDPLKMEFRNTMSGMTETRAVYRESCDNRNLGAILCPKCPATGIACIDFKV